MNYKPACWELVAYLPTGTYRSLGRFINRQDAEDFKRFLSRKIPSQSFEIIFHQPD